MKENNTSGASKQGVVMVLLVLVLCICTGLLGYYIGKTSSGTVSANGRLAGYVSKTGKVPGQDFALPQSSDQAKEALKAFSSEERPAGFTYGKNKDAMKVIMVEDFSCPMCTQFFRQAYPSLKERADRGEIQLVWYNRIIFADKGSDIAARGAVAAANQGHLWDFVSYAYESAGDGDHPEYNEALVIKLAKEAGVKDMKKFEEDLKSSKVKEIVEGDDKRATELGVTGTPFFVLGDATVIAGAYPKDYFLNTLDFLNYKG